MFMREFEKEEKNSIVVVMWCWGGKEQRERKGKQLPPQLKNNALDSPPLAKLAVWKFQQFLRLCASTAFCQVQQQVLIGQNRG